MRIGKPSTPGRENLKGLSSFWFSLPGPLPFLDPDWGGTSLAGFEFLHAGPGSLRWKKGVHTLLNGFAQGWLHLPVVARFPLAEAAKAHELLAGRGVQGKVLLAVNEDR